jgi:arsenate reductase
MIAHSVQVLYTDECQHAREAMAVAKSAASDLMPGADVSFVRIADMDEARAAGFTGSPTIKVDGMDIEGNVRGEPSLACRLYTGYGMLPPEWMMEAGILRALKPQRILFMCVANSARSQMAEGIARSLAPHSVDIVSAGSNPGGLSRTAVEVMNEIGIDISCHHSKSVEEIGLESIDAVITLCSHEVCPVTPQRVARVHWRLTDPSGAGMDEAEKIKIFRSIRDELRRRLGFLFSGWKS